MSEASTAGASSNLERSQSDDLGFPSNSDTTPPTLDDIDRWQYRISLQEFGEDLHAAAQAVFPNNARSRYTRVFVLMLCWEDEDPKLPVSLEIDKLFDVFKYTYNFETEVWRIPDRNCHARTNQKILNFVEMGDDSSEHLKIIYYAGHAKLSKNRLLTWTSWRYNHLSKCPTVKWSGIQNALEEAQSDVLILLDCCAGGAVNTLEGNGVTELIAACGYNAIANGVGPYSFTHALILELLELSNKPSFTVAYLYNNIFTRIQGRIPEDGRERHPPPIHLVLTQESQLPRSIQLSKCQNLAERFELEAREISFVVQGKRPEGGDKSSRPLTVEDIRPEAGSFLPPPTPSPPARVPRLAFAIRLNDTLRPDQLRTDLFVEWLRSMPAIAEEVKVEAGFDSFSSLIILSIPIALSTFLSHNSAIVSLGPITSPNKVRPPKAAPQRPRVIHSRAAPTNLGTRGRSEQMVVIEPTQNSKRSRDGKSGPIYHQQSYSMEPVPQPKPKSARPQAPSVSTSVLGQVLEEAHTTGPSKVRVKSPGTYSQLQSAKRLPTIDEVHKNSQKPGYPTPPSSGETTPRSSQEIREPLPDGR